MRFWCRIGAHDYGSMWPGERVCRQCGHEQAPRQLPRDPVAVSTPPVLHLPDSARLVARLRTETAHAPETPYELAVEGTEAVADRGVLYVHTLDGYRPVWVDRDDLERLHASVCERLLPDEP